MPETLTKYESHHWKKQTKDKTEKYLNSAMKITKKGYKTGIETEQRDTW